MFDENFNVKHFCTSIPQTVTIPDSDFKAKPGQDNNMSAPGIQPDVDLFFEKIIFGSFFGGRTYGFWVEKKRRSSFSTPRGGSTSQKLSREVEPPREKMIFSRGRVGSFFGSQKRP